MILRNFVYRLGTRSLLVALGFPVSILVARTLGPQDRAILGYGMAIASIATLLGQLGMSWRLSREFKRGDLSEADYRIAAVEVGCFAAIFTTLAAGAVYFIYGLRGPALPHLAAIAAFAVFTGWFEIGQRLVLFLDRHGLYNRNSLFKTLCDLGLVIAAVSLLHDKVNGVLAAHVAAIGVGLAVIFHSLRWRPRLTVPWRARWVSLARLKQSVRYQAMPVMAMLNRQVGVFIVGLATQTAEAGTFVVAASIGMMMMMIPESLQTVIIGKAYAIRSRDDVEIYLQQVRAGSVFYVLLGLVVIPIGYFVFPVLYGRDYTGLGVMFVAVAVASQFRGIRLLLSGLYAGLDKPERAALITTIGLVLRLVLMPAALFTLGVAAMAWASTLVAAIELGLSLRECSRLSGMSVTRRLIPSSADFRNMVEVLWKKGRRRLAALTS